MKWNLFGYLHHYLYLTSEEICRECMAAAPIPEPIVERIVERIETIKFIEREYSLSESIQLVLAALWKIMYTREAMLIAAISSAIIAAVLTAWSCWSRWMKKLPSSRPLHMTYTDSGGRHRYVPAMPNGNLPPHDSEQPPPHPIMDRAPTPVATSRPHPAAQCPPITINNNTTK